MGKRDADNQNTSRQFRGGGERPGPNERTGKPRQGGNAAPKSSAVSKTSGSASEQGGHPENVALIKTAEGLAKVALGIAAGVILLYAVLHSIWSGMPISRQVLIILAGLLSLFFGVDVFKIYRNGGLLP